MNQMNIQKIMIFGASGQLGSELASTFDAKYVVTPKRSEFLTLANKTDTDIKEWFANYPQVQEVHFASGIIDASHPIEMLRLVNLDLPLKLARNAGSRKIMTYGTIMERVIEPEKMNPYLRSKFDLGQALEKLRNNQNCQSLHFQLHTLYGGKIAHPNMFTGQIFKALQSKTSFEMSQGHQIREYHHVKDDVAAIKELIQTLPNGAYGLSHHKPITLAELAQSVFSHFNLLGLLKIGVKPSSPAEYFDPIRDSEMNVDSQIFRETRQGVNEWLEQLLKNSLTSTSKNKILVD